MAQHLHQLLEEPNDTHRTSPGASKHQKRRHHSANAGFHASTKSSHLRNDESDGLDSDNSDDGWTRSFGRVVPMAQQLQALVGEDCAHSRQYPSTRKQKGKGSPASNGVEHLRNDKAESLGRDIKDAERTRSFGGSVPMARRLQELVGENRAHSILQKQKGKVEGFYASNGSDHSRNDESEGLDSDNSDDGWTRSSGRGVPMAQQLEALVGDDCAHSQQYLSVRKQKGNGAADFEVEIVDTDDSNEPWDEFPAEIAPEPSAVAKTHPLPSIEEQFQEALLAAPASASPLLPFQIPRDQALLYSTQLQRVLQLEKVQHAQITKGPPSKGAFPCIQVQILKKSLEGRLTTCKCQVVQAPLKWMRESLSASNVDTVHVIFNARVAVELELEVGGMVRINPPWRDVTLPGSFKRVILCTYFCEAVC